MILWYFFVIKNFIICVLIGLEIIIIIFFEFGVKCYFLVDICFDCIILVVGDYSLFEVEDLLK